MNFTYRLLLIFFLFSRAEKAYCAVSIVYNLRIAETTKQPPDQKTQGNFIEAITLFGQFRERRDNTRQNLGGALETFVYMPEPFYVKADFAVAHIHERSEIGRRTRTQTDDILFSAGYSFLASKRVKITLSGLLGIPTHKELTLIELQFGTGHFALGAQADGAYIYSSDKNHSLRWATRLIHFFPRMTPFINNGKRLCVRYNIGNLADVFIAHVSRLNNHRFGVGYDQVFLFKASIFPVLGDIVQRTNYIRSSFYASYKYSFAINKYASAFGGGLSYGFDLIPKQFGIKRQITAWLSFGINF